MKEGKIWSEQTMMKEGCEGKIFNEKDSIEAAKNWAKKLVEDIQWIHKNISVIKGDKDNTPYDTMLKSITKVIIGYREMVMDEMKEKCGCVKCEFSKTCFYSPVRKKEE